MSSGDKPNLCLSNFHVETLFIKNIRRKFWVTISIDYTNHTHASFTQTSKTYFELKVDMEIVFDIEKL